MRCVLPRSPEPYFRTQPCLSHRVHCAQAPSAAVGAPAPAWRSAVSQQRFGQQPSLGTTLSYKLPTQNKRAEKAAGRVMKRQRNESQWERLREPLRLASLGADGRARRLLRSSAGAKDLQEACQLKWCNRCGCPHFTERAQATPSPARRPAPPRSLCAYSAQSVPMPEALAQHQRAWVGDRPRLGVLTRCRAALQPAAAALPCWAGHNAAMPARGSAGLSPPAAMRAGRGPGKEVGLKCDKHRWGGAGSCTRNRWQQRKTGGQGRGPAGHRGDGGCCGGADDTRRDWPPCPQQPGFAAPSALARHSCGAVALCARGRVGLGLGGAPRWGTPQRAQLVSVTGCHAARGFSVVPLAGTAGRLLCPMGRQLDSPAATRAWRGVPSSGGQLE